MVKETRGERVNSKGSGRISERHGWTLDNVLRIDTGSFNLCSTVLASSICVINVCEVQFISLLAIGKDISLRQSTVHSG